MSKIGKLVFVFLSCLMFAMTIAGESLVLAQGGSELEKVDVRGTLRREELETTSAATISGEEIRDHIYNHSGLDMLQMVPGVSIGVPMANGTTGMVYIRGFSGGHTGEISFYIDGIPMQEGGHSDNYVDMGMIMPMELESLEVVKGPASVNYGRNSAGGAVSFQTIKEGNFTRLMGRTGSEALMDFSGIVAKELGPVNHVYAFQLYRDPGWRDHDEMNRYNVSGRWTVNPTDELSISLNLRAYRTDWESAGSIYKYMPRDSAVDDGSGNFAGGFRNRFDGRLWANYFITDEQQLTFYAFVTDLNAERRTLSLPGVALAPLYPNFPPNTPVASRIEATSRWAYGTGLAYNYSGNIFGRAASFTAGVEYQHELEKRNYYTGNVIWGYGPYKSIDRLSTEIDYTINTLTFLAEASYQVLDPLKIRVGFRYENWTGSLKTGPYHDGTAWVNPDSNYKAPRRTAFNPKAGILYTPLDWLEMFVGYGRAYNLPSLSGDYFARPTLELSQRDQIEIGTRLSPFGWLEFGSTYFWLKTTNDSQTDPVTSDIIYVGETLRQGLENYLKITPFDYFNINFDYTYMDAKQKQGVSGVGNRLNNVPRHTTNIQVGYSPPTGLGGYLRFNWSSGFAQRSTLSDWGYLSGQINYRINDNYKIRFDVLNILDKTFERYDPNNFATYSPMQPRLMYLSVEANWE